MSKQLRRRLSVFFRIPRKGETIGDVLVDTQVTATGVKKVTKESISVVIAPVIAVEATRKRDTLRRVLSLKFRVAPNEPSKDLSDLFLGPPFQTSDIDLSAPIDYHDISCDTITTKLQAGDEPKEAVLEVEEEMIRIPDIYPVVHSLERSDVSSFELVSEYSDISVESPEFVEKYKHSFKVAPPPKWLPKDKHAKWERSQMLRHSTSTLSLKKASPVSKFPADINIETMFKSMTTLFAPKRVILDHSQDSAGISKIVNGLFRERSRRYKGGFTKHWRNISLVRENKIPVIFSYPSLSQSITSTEDFVF